MAKIKAMSLLQMLSGKLGKDEKYYFSYSSKTGQITMKRCPESVPSDSEAARHSRERFARLSRAAKEWMDENRPGRMGNPDLDGTLEYYKMRCAYERQKRISSFFAYVISRMSMRLEEENAAGASNMDHRA